MGYQEQDCLSRYFRKTVVFELATILCFMEHMKSQARICHGGEK